MLFRILTAACFMMSVQQRHFSGNFTTCPIFVQASPYCAYAEKAHHSVSTCISVEVAYGFIFAS